MFREVRPRWVPALLLAASLASLAAAQTPDEVQGWLKAVDAARSAFGEAKLRARATQVENGKVLGTADFDIYVKDGDDVKTDETLIQLE